MARRARKRRLDEILLNQGLVTESQVREALMRQRVHGGKFGSQLLYHRFIDEAMLVRALAKQFNCDGIELSNMEISPDVISQIPKKVALSRKVIPFAYDSKSNELKVACENPSDQTLLDELGFLARGREIRLYVAPEIVINTAIARYYLGRDVSLEDNLLLTIPDSATDVGQTIAMGEPPDEDASVAKPSVLLITDEVYSAPLLQSVLERDGYQVVTSESADDAMKLLEDQHFSAIFIKYTVQGDYLELIDRARRITPQTNVRYYDTASSLLFNREAFGAGADINNKNLELLTSLLCSKDRVSHNHSARVGHYVDRLCRQLNLSDRDRLLISNAGYLHDMARFYYTAEQAEDSHTIVELTAKLLASLNYSPVTVQMLRSMYRDLKGRYTTRLSIEGLGGNILTIVDLYCDSVPQHQNLTLDRFDAVIKEMRDLIGKLLLAGVVEAFIEMIQQEILGLQTSQKASQVMIFCEDLRLQQPLEMRLRNEGLRTVAHVDVASLVELYQRSVPDIMILVLPGKHEEIMLQIGKIVSGGVSFQRTPTFLLVDGSSVSQMTEVLERGIEDVVAIDDNLDLLVTKIHRLQSKLRAQAERDQSLGIDTEGARGRLADMNLIDLLQALGPSRKTVKITVQPQTADSTTLTVFLELGDIIYAEYKDLDGAEAIYEGLTWCDGIWTITPIGIDKLPSPNNHLGNETILMEGCRLLDERVRSG
jgi:DNA-binding response OmpR family regulator